MRKKVPLRDKTRRGEKSPVKKSQTGLKNPVKNLVKNPLLAKRKNREEICRLLTFSELLIFVDFLWVNVSHFILIRNAQI